MGTFQPNQMRRHEQERKRTTEKNNKSLLAQNMYGGCVECVCVCVCVFVWSGESEKKVECITFPDLYSILIFCLHQQMNLLVENN